MPKFKKKSNFQFNLGYLFVIASYKIYLPLSPLDDSSLYSNIFYILLQNFQINIKYYNNNTR